MYINDKWHIASISEGNTALGGGIKIGNLRLVIGP